MTGDTTGVVGVNRFTVLILFLFSFCPCSWAQFIESADAIQTTGKLEPVESLFVKKLYKEHNIADRTKDALLSYPEVEATANYWARRIQRKTLGEYAEHLMYVAPFVTGEVSLRYKKLDFNLDYKDQKGKVQFVHKF